MTFYRTLLFILLFALTACGASKKNTTTIQPSVSSDVIHTPGEAELVAFQSSYSKATMAQINQGFAIYTKGACTKCHEVEEIYKFSETRWVKIIDEMSIKAKLSSDQKEAIYQYIMAVKATQPANH